MKRRITLLIVLGFLAIGTVGSSIAQEIPAVGFSALVCRLGVHGSGHYCAPGNAQLCLDVTDGAGTATVTVHHGQTQSTHTVTYIDDGDGELDCGDTITSVS